MTQHAYSIANQAGAAFRGDLNNALAAIVSQNSGATAPAATYAYMFWADTTTGLLKLRDAANAAWITVGELGVANLGIMSLVQSTIQDGSENYLGSVTGTGTITATASPTLTAQMPTGSLWKMPAAGANAGAATINVDGQGAVSIVRPDGTALQANDIPAAGYIALLEKRASDVVLLNPANLTAQQLYQAVPAGTIIDFSGTAAPAGFLACPTSSTNVSRTTYAALFAAIGTTWGAGDGSTTFGLPYFPADYAAVQANANVGTGTVGQVISHTHTTDAINVVAGGGAYQTAAGTVEHFVGAGINSTGGPDNLAAGQRVLKCVKY